MVKELFYEDTYLREHKAKITACEKIADKYGVSLDETIFYPEGGGEPGDRGWFDKIEVVDTIKKEGEIYHLTKKPLNPGDSVSIKLDWAFRYDLMQFHTSQHLLSSVIYDLYKGNTLSVHVGTKNAHIDVDLPSLNWEMVREIELKANTLIYQNLSVKTYWIKDQKELDKIPFRRAVKKKAEKGVRVVEIEGFDYSACGGMHLKKLGEIGILKIVKWTNIKEGTQIEFLFGKRALLDYEQKTEILQRLTNALTCHDLELEAKVLAFKQNNQKMEKQIKMLNAELMEYKIPKILENATIIDGVRIITDNFEDKDPKDMKLILNKFMDIPNIICLFTDFFPDSSKILVFFAHSLEKGKDKLHMGNVLKKVLPLINGKGGGKPQYAQGGGKGKIPDNFLPEAVKIVIDELKK
ncbi:MAG: hypothetical protein DRO88_06525 [Promethearchaeia archaeon]|nr:MAG: hypothetical protein DRO88_06525 [Candidatus Lokiarchaeia archaeon]